MDFSNRVKQITLIGIVLTGMILISAPWANAHFGGFIVQLQNGSLVIGQDSETPGGQPDWNTKAVGSLFAPEQYSDLPSFLSLASAPAGTQALPPLASIYWDFLPMSTDGYTSNLLYWNGQGSVDFGPVPIPPGATDVTLGIYNTTDVGNPSAIVSDTPDMVAGALLGVTNTVGSGLRLHRHNYFLLDDGDGVAPTNIAEGVYLVALQLDMPGYGTSRPIFVVPGTYGLISQTGGVTKLNTAVAWVNENAALLIRDGDYDFDGDVDTADYTTWMQQFGSTGPWPINGDFADGNRDTIVNAADYVLWRKFQGEGGAGSGAGLSGSVPEPSLLTLFGGTAAALLLLRKRA